MYNTKQLPYSLVYLLSLPYLIDFICFYFASSSEEKKYIRYSYDYFMCSPGVYSVAKKIYEKNNQIKVVVVANDHTPKSRCMIEAANELNITTIYTQHASISNKFPPLHFSFSFLDGEESYEKYRQIGDITGKVLLLGSPRFDYVMKIRKELAAVKREYIGVSLNLLDSLNKALDLCLYLKESTGKKVIIRPHPRMVNFDSSIFIANGIEVSDSNNELSFDFLSRLEILIANESGIHLDAAIFGVPSILFNLSDNELLDWYGYLRKGLTTLAKTPEDVMVKLDSIHPTTDEIVQYYYAAFHTKFDGNVARTIAEFLDYTSNDGNVQAFLGDFFKEQEPGVYSIR